MSYLQIGELCESFIAARLDTFIRPIACVDSADAFRENTQNKVLITVSLHLDISADLKTLTFKHSVILFNCKRDNYTEKIVKLGHLHPSFFNDAIQF